MIDFTNTNSASGIGESLTSKTSELVESISDSQKNIIERKAKKLRQIDKDIIEEESAQLFGLGDFLKKIETSSQAENTKNVIIAQSGGPQEIENLPVAKKVIDNITPKVITPEVFTPEINAFDPSQTTKTVTNVKIVTKKSIDDEITKTKAAEVKETVITTENIEEAAKVELKKKIKELDISQTLGELADKARLLFVSKPLIKPSVKPITANDIKYVMYRYDILTTNKFKDLEAYSGRLVVDKKLEKYLDESSILFNTEKVLENKTMAFVVNLKVPLSEKLEIEDAKLILKTHIFPFGPDNPGTETDFLNEKPEQETFGEVSDSIIFDFSTVEKPEAPDIEIVSYRGNSSKLIFNFWPRYVIENYNFTNYYLKEYIIERSIDTTNWEFVGKTESNEDTYVETNTIINTKVYYRFSSKDTVEQVSKKSPIYEVVFREFHGTLFLEVEIHKEETIIPSRLKMKSRIKIEPSSIQKELIEDPKGLSVVRKYEVGKKSKGSLWYDKPNIKIRVTSKKTRRKFDLNINFNLIEKDSIDKKLPVKEILKEAVYETDLLDKKLPVKETTKEVIKVLETLVI